MLFLEDGEIAEVTRDAVTLFDFEGQPRKRAPRRVTWDAVTAQKGGYKHFLLKEIHEQPQALIDTLRGRIRLESGDVHLAELEPIAARLERVERLTLTACGTAWHAALVGKFFLNELTRLPVEVDYASELRYRAPVLGERDLLVVVSQSGETADTLGALEEAKRAGAATLAICNVVDSSIARRADAVLYTHAGPEISVASTKAFTTQLAAFLLLAVSFGRRLGRLDPEQGRSLLAALRNVPQLVEQALPVEHEVAQLARKYAQARDFLYLGRGINYPVALEGALKLKELSYIHAEGYPAGEMKHGPIALITEALPVVVMLPHDELYAKSLSNLKEVESRGGKIIAVTDRPSAGFAIDRHRHARGAVKLGAAFAVLDDDPAATARVPRRRRAGQRRRSTSQSRQERHGRVAGRITCAMRSRTWWAVSAATSNSLWGERAPSTR